MRSKTGNVRRATQDLDIDFIRYSLADESIDIFIDKMNCLEEIRFKRFGKIEELKQQDYSGKRVYVTISDQDGNEVRSKIDLGVHNRLELDQEEYCFDIAYDDEGASLLINSNEQMFSEKLSSLLRFGSLSTRFKDIYDMYYLKDHIHQDRLLQALDIYIYNDEKMRENESKDIQKRLKMTFQDKEYVRALKQSDKRWVDTDVKEVLDSLLDFIDQLKG